MRKFLLTAAAAAAMVATSAQAVPTMVVSVIDTGTATQFDCSVTAAGLGACAAGFTLGALNGAGNLEVSFGGLVGGYALSFTGTQANAPGNATEAFINLSYTGVRNVSSAGRLLISVSSYDFTLPAGPDLTLFGSQAMSSNLTSFAGNIESNYFASATNNTLPQTAATATLACDFNTQTQAGCDAGNTNWTRNAGAFSLQDIVAFQLTATGLSSSGVNGSSNLIVRNRIPEPMSTALVGMGLFGLAFFSRRRAKQA